MAIITATQLRRNQRKFLKLAETEPVYVSRRGAPALQILPADENGLTPKELESVRRGLEDIRTGKMRSMQPNETLDDFLNRVCIE